MFQISATCTIGATGFKVQQNPPKNAIQNAGTSLAHEIV